jgi:N-acetyl-anhydromuramyl-L-alanine amidase AmpD
MKRHLLTAVLLLLLFSCSSDRIIDRPVSFDQERIDLTLEYLDKRYGLKQSEPIITPKMVVVHYTVIPTLEKSFAAFEKAKLPDWRPEIIDASALNVSSQFLVDLDGSIYRLMPETRMARHVIGLNHCAIGIENVGGTKEVPLTEAQLEANIWLAKYLKEKYDIKYLIGHSEYTNFETHELWLEVDDGYRTEKSDPGDKFLADIRTATKDLGFLPVPEKR